MSMKCWKCGAEQDQKLDEEIRAAVLRCIEICKELGDGWNKMSEPGNIAAEQIAKEFNLKC